MTRRANNRKRHGGGLVGDRTGFIRLALRVQVVLEAGNRIENLHPVRTLGAHATLAVTVETSCVRVVHMRAVTESLYRAAYFGCLQVRGSFFAGTGREAAR